MDRRQLFRPVMAGSCTTGDVVGAHVYAPSGGPGQRRGVTGALWPSRRPVPDPREFRMQSRRPWTAFGEVRAFFLRVLPRPLRNVCDAEPVRLLPVSRRDPLGGRGNASE